MMKNYRSLISASVLLFLLTAGAVCAQRQVVTGKVADGSGGPLPGVNVLVKGSSAGTATDVNGVFSLEVDATDVLVVTFIGYKTLEVPVGNQTQLTVTLEEDVSTLEEVVVIGYGVQKKALNTGANVHVSGGDLQRLSTTNALQALQGQAAGVQISSTSGQPGEPLKVRIRGIGTIGNAEPLYVVDGVLTSDITYLNPVDIESIDVLKDAASAAIYGSQAANGVVLITTKSGKSGKAQIAFDAFYGVQNVARKVDMLDAHEYGIIMNEAAINSGKLPRLSGTQLANPIADTRWMDQMFVKDAPTQNYSLSASGGNESSIYSTSLSYLSQTGIVGGSALSGYSRYNFRINSEHKLYKDVVKVGENLTFAYVDNNGISVGNQYNNSLRAAFNTSPFVPMYGDDGKFYDNSNSTWYNGEGNPYAAMVYNNQNERNNQKLLGNIYMEVEPLKGLRFRSSLGLDFATNESRSYSPTYQLSIYSYRNVNSATQSMGRDRKLLWDNLISYGMNIAGDHRVDVMLGSSWNHYKGSYLQATNTNLVFDDLDHAWIDNATNTEGVNYAMIGKPNDEVKLLSYFGRVNYNFKETFLLNATFRADGSSRFIGKNQWGYFPSVSAGWIMTNSSFLAGTTNWLEYFKLRASWGQVGNQNIGTFQYMAPVNFQTTNYIFGNTEGALTPGAYVKRLANPNVKWEASEQTDIGFDARVLQGKLQVSFDWYSKVTKDWLVVAPILATAGADAPFINGGNVKNSGVELALSYTGYAGGFGYTLNVNGAYNKNRVTDIPTQDGIVHGQTRQLYDNAGEFYRAQSGFPIGYFWGLSTDGIFQTEEEVQAYRSGEGQLIQPTAQPGDVRFVDRNGDGVIDDLDRGQIGNPNPNYTFGFSATATFKGFDFLLQTNGVAGNEIVQSYRNQANQYANYTTEILDRWHGPGSSNTMPRVTESNSNLINFSDLYIHKGDFLRISNVTLGYDFMKILKRKPVSQLRLYVTAQNLFTFTKYEGMDPEVGYGIDETSGKNNNVAQNSFSSGIDLGYYPRPRTYMVGVNIKF